MGIINQLMTGRPHLVWLSKNTANVSWEIMENHGKYFANCMWWMACLKMGWTWISPIKWYKVVVLTGNKMTNYWILGVPFLVRHIHVEHGLIVWSCGSPSSSGTRGMNIHQSTICLQSGFSMTNSSVFLEVVTGKSVPFRYQKPNRSLTRPWNRKSLEIVTVQQCYPLFCPNILYVMFKSQFSLGEIPISAMWNPDSLGETRTLSTLQETNSWMWCLPAWM